MVFQPMGSSYDPKNSKDLKYYELVFRFFTGFFNFKIKVPVTITINQMIENQIKNSFDFFGYKII